MLNLPRQEPWVWRPRIDQSQELAISMNGSRRRIPDNENAAGTQGLILLQNGQL